MEVRYRLNGQAFIWDPGKARENLRKHGISFELACEVFDDPFAAVVDASRQGENRLALIGRTERDELLFVVLVEVDPDGAIIRIVSARRATARERRHYEEGDFEG